MAVVPVLLFGLLAYFFAQEALHRRVLKKIPLRILVNGTRGKTSVTRLMAAVLNEAGIRTYAKTTGSQARRILPDGTEQAYRGRRPASLTEQLPFMRLAARGGAKAVVVECMALRPENQRVMAEKLVCPHYTVITNSHVDHAEEIGATREETARTLALSVHSKGTLVTGDPFLMPCCSRLILPEEGTAPPWPQSLPFAPHAENLALVLALAGHLGIPRDTALRGMQKARPDIGLYSKFRADGVLVYNAFSANDPHSFSLALKECAGQGGYALLFNHRPDRLWRLTAFSRVLEAVKERPVRIGVIGKDRSRAARLLGSAARVPARAVADAWAWLREEGMPARVLCCGNIKGEGEALINRLLEEGNLLV